MTRDKAVTQAMGLIGTRTIPTTTITSIIIIATTITAITTIMAIIRY